MKKTRLAIFLVSSAVLLFMVRHSGPEENIRPPTAAGKFYPGDASELYNLVEHLMASSPAKGFRGVRAVLVPHAGYAYSAVVAAESFREVTSDFRRVFLLASNHRGDVDFAGVSLPAETHYSIPGAKIPVSGIVSDLRGKPGFVDEPAAHTMHMIEVELPFLHFLKKLPVHPDFEIVPMILGRMDRAAVSRLAEVLDRYADDRTLFVFSVDLSHYFSDQEARKLDKHTIESIMSRDTQGLAGSTTDGNQVLLTMQALANLRGWESAFLKYRNSGDATGDLNRVVGYASILFHDPLSLTDEERHELLRVAHRAVETTVRSGREPEPSGEPVQPVLNIPRGAFVTLKKNGRLRGCIGNLFPTQSLYEGIRKNAASAATHDPRFPPVTEDELDLLTVAVSVLDYPRRVETFGPSDYLKALTPKKDGVILLYGGRQSTFLPTVWEEIPAPEDFLSGLCRKQESPADCWKDSKATLYRYGAFEFGE